MEIDLELYREDVVISERPHLRLSAIDVEPEPLSGAAPQPPMTLVFLHGYGGQATQWRYQVRAFADTHRCIALDLRGHGHSDKPASAYTMAELLHDLEDALDALGVPPRFVLAGHSFGGAIAAEYALAHPDRVEKLVLVATAARFRIYPWARWLLRLPVTALRPLSKVIRRALAAPPHVLKAMHTHAIERWDGLRVFPRLNVPTLVIRGHGDRVFAQAEFEEVARLIPGAEEVDVGVSGHMVMLERRDAVNRAIARFLAEDGGRRSDDLRLPSSVLRLKKERPWLVHYDQGVPPTIAIPRRALHRFLSGAARRLPNRPAIYYYGARLSYAQLNRLANRCANALRALGVDKGDRVMLLLPNLPQAVIAYYGALKAGAVVVFTSPVAEEAEIVRQVRDSGAEVLITLTRFSDLARRVKDQTGLRHIVLTHAKEYLPWLKRLVFTLTREQKEGHRLSRDELEPGMHLFQDLLRRYPPLRPEVEIAPDDLAVIQYTGGTTATPKGVMLSHRNLVANALQTRHWFPDLREGREVVLSVLPFSHIYGTTAAMNVPVALGAAMVILPQFEVMEVLRAIKRYRPTLFPGVPMMYLAITNVPNVRRFGLASIRYCISGAAPLPVEVQEAFERLTGARLVEGYGLTEASPVTHVNPIHGRRKPGSIGIPLPSTEARIVDLVRRRPVKPGEIGELVVRGPQVMVGYWGQSGESERALVDGWLYTGDVARMDEDGYFQIISRRQDIWYPERARQRGRPAFPRDVEEVLFEYPKVKEAVVMGIEGLPVAFVIPKEEPVTAAELIAYCKRRLPPELVPRLVLFVPDFPRSFVGKVLRRELLRRWEAAHGPIQVRAEAGAVADHLGPLTPPPAS